MPAKSRSSSLAALAVPERVGGEEFGDQASSGSTDGSESTRPDDAKAGAASDPGLDAKLDQVLGALKSFDDRLKAVEQGSSKRGEVLRSMMRETKEEHADEEDEPSLLDLLAGRKDKKKKSKRKKRKKKKSRHKRNSSWRHESSDSSSDSESSPSGSSSADEGTSAADRPQAPHFFR